MSKKQTKSRLLTPRLLKFERKLQVSRPQSLTPGVKFYVESKSEVKHIEILRARGEQIGHKILRNLTI